MQFLIELIISIVAIFGILGVIACFLHISEFKYFDFSKAKKIDIYLNNFSEEESDDIVKKITNSLNVYSDAINVYKTFDK
jgi:hypothetical protein